MSRDHGLPLDGEILPPVSPKPRVPFAVPAQTDHRPPPLALRRPDLGYFQNVPQESKKVGIRAAFGIILFGICLAIGVANLNGFEATSSEPQGSALHVVHLKSRVLMRDGETTLFVDGTLRNSSNASQALPPMRVRVISPAGNVQFFPLKADSAVSPIAPGAETAFGARYPIDSNGVRSVSIIIF